MPLQNARSGKKATIMTSRQNKKIPQFGGYLWVFFLYKMPFLKIDVFYKLYIIRYTMFVEKITCLTHCKGYTLTFRPFWCGSFVCIIPDISGNPIDSYTFR
jgi:hypothetical protein